MMLDVFALDLKTIRIVSAIGMLIFVSFLDLKKREVHDLVWIIFGIEGGILLFFEVFPFILKTLISLIIAPIAILIWRFGMFGGADTLCLIVLAILAPTVTIVDNGLVHPFTTLTNALLVSIIPLLINAIVNAVLLARKRDIFAGFDESKMRKAIAIFLGQRSKTPRYSFSLERQKPNSKYKQFDFKLHHAEEGQFCEKPDTWVTPGIPFLLCITGGFIIQIFFGDILLNLLSNML